MVIFFSKDFTYFRDSMWAGEEGESGGEGGRREKNLKQTRQQSPKPDSGHSFTT